MLTLRLRDAIYATAVRLIRPLAVVSAAALYFNVPVSRAFADAPWCAVTNKGTGNMYWDCQYNSFEACVPTCCLAIAAFAT